MFIYNFKNIHFNMNSLSQFWVFLVKSMDLMLK